MLSPGVPEPSLSEPLRRSYEQIRALLATAARDEVRTRYRVGRLLLRIKKAPGTYGTGAVKELARALGKDGATLYRYAVVPERWSPIQMKALAARRTPSGEPLSWSHLVELAQVDSKELRDRLVERALHARMSVRELARQIEEASEDGTARAPETSSREALVSLTARADRLSAQVSGDLADLVDPRELLRLHAQDVDALLARAIRAHAGLCDRARARLEELVKVRDRLVTERAPRVHGPRRVGWEPGAVVAGVSRS